MELLEPRAKANSCWAKRAESKVRLWLVFTKQVFLTVENLFTGTESNTLFDGDETENEIK